MDNSDTQAQWHKSATDTLSMTYKNGNGRTPKPFAGEIASFQSIQSIKQWFLLSIPATMAPSLTLLLTRSGHMRRKGCETGAELWKLMDFTVNDLPKCTLKCFGTASSHFWYHVLLQVLMMMLSKCQIHLTNLNTLQCSIQKKKSLSDGYQYWATKRVPRLPLTLRSRCFSTKMLSWRY